MDILVGDIYSEVVSPLSHSLELAIIRLVCRARPDSYRYMPKYKAGLWDGYVSLMRGMEFPTGLLPLIEKKLVESGYTVNYVCRNSTDNSPVKVQANILKGVILRDYQLKAVNKLIASKRGIARMATNSGKTEVMAAIIKGLGLPAIVLVNIKDLMYQTAERFQNRGLDDVGMIGDSIWQPGKVTVAMVQTLRHHKLPFKDNAILIADECHHVSSDTFLDVMFRIPGQYRFGMSGTPLKNSRLADMKLIGATGQVIVKVSNAYMIDQGYSATPDIDVIIIEDFKEDNWDMDYKDAYNLLIVNNDLRNEYIARIAKRHKSVLILVNRIDHGRVLAHKLPGSTFVSGASNTEFRKSVLDAMRSKDGIYIASPIFDEGVDVPSISCVIIASGGKSTIKLLQRIGRGLRQKEYNNRLKVYDFLDDTNKYLLRHSSARINLYDKEGFTAKLVERL